MVFRCLSLDRVCVALSAILGFLFSITIPQTVFAHSLPEVARLSVVQGDVWIDRPDSRDPIVASVNTPLLAGETLETSADSRAEIELGGLTALRVSHDTTLFLKDLNFGHREVQLAQGVIEESVFPGYRTNTLIDTPALQITGIRNGLYRISVDSNGQTRLTVRRGSAKIAWSQGATLVSAGSAVQASGNDAAISLSYLQPESYDAFEAFNQQRDARQRTLLAEATSFAPIEGFDDLPTYGRWYADDRYGRIWVPNEPLGWAPYRDGRWVSEESYGLTWVAAEPWGWTPYHYGRWFYRPAYDSWAWVPPQSASIAPAWSPALVGFVSIGHGFSFGFSESGIGWVPLAPAEPCVPWWRTYDAHPRRGDNTTIIHSYTNNISYETNYITNTTIRNNITNTKIVYRNILVKNAVTAVNRRDFDRGILSHHIVVRTADLRQNQPFLGVLPPVVNRDQRSLYPTFQYRHELFQRRELLARRIANKQSPSFNALPRAEKKNNRIMTMPFGAKMIDEKRTDARRSEEKRINAIRMNEKYVQATRGKQNRAQITPHDGLVLRPNIQDQATLPSQVARRHHYALSTAHPQDHTSHDSGDVAYPVIEVREPQLLAPKLHARAPRAFRQPIAAAEPLLPNHERFHADTIETQTERGQRAYQRAQKRSQRGHMQGERVPMPAVRSQRHVPREERHFKE